MRHRYRFILLCSFIFVVGGVGCVTDLPPLDGFPCTRDSDCNKGLKCWTEADSRCHAANWVPGSEETTTDAPPAESKPEPVVENVQEPSREPGNEGGPETKAELGPEPDPEPVEDAGPESGPEESTQPDAGEPVPEVTQDIPPPCGEGTTRDCGQSNTGECKKGQQTCSNGAWGPCVGEVKPMPDYCDDKKDNDCDGKVDNNCVSTCVPKDTAYVLKSPHPKHIRGVAISSDNKWMVTIDESTIRVWSLVLLSNQFFFSQPEHYTLSNKHTAAMTALAFSVDSSRLHFATGDASGNIKVWDVQTKQLLHELKSGSQGHSGSIAGLQFRYNTNTLLSCSADKTCLTWDLNASSPKGVKLTIPTSTKGDDAFTVVSCAAQADLCAMGMKNGRTLILKGTTVSEGAAADAEVVGLAVDVKGLRIARIAKQSKRVTLLNATGQNTSFFNLSNVPSDLTAVAFNTLVSELSIGTSNGAIYNYDLRGTSSDPIEGHTGEITALVYRPDGKWLLSASADKSLEARGGTKKGLLFGWGATDKPIQKLVMWPDGKQFLSLTSDTLLRWNLETGTYDYRLDLRAENTSVGPVEDLAVGPLRSYIAWARAGQLYLQDFIKSSQSKHTIFAASSDRILAMAWHPLEYYIVLVTSASQNNVILWDVEQKKVIHSVTEVDAKRAAFSSNGGLIFVTTQASQATASRGKWYYLFNRELQLDTRGTVSMAADLKAAGFLKDGLDVGVVSSLGDVRSYRIASNGTVINVQRLKSLSGATVNDASIDPTEKHIALATKSTSAGGQGVQIWELSTQSTNTQPLAVVQSTKVATAVTYDTTGRLLVSGFEDGTIQVNSCACGVGQSTVCYTSRPYTRGVGECVPAEQACSSQGFFMSCGGKAPEPEVTQGDDGLDNNCDGQVDDASIDFSVFEIRLDKKIVSPGGAVQVTVCPDFSNKFSLARPLNVLLYLAPMANSEPSAGVALNGSSPLPSFLQIKPFPVGTSPSCSLVQTITIPTGTKLGSHYILAYVDWGDLLREASEKNNIGSASITVGSTRP
ncbi:MAG: hypothetical protein EP343_13750 [Deltaproteobacteria bacterium]|nr:MAG: hypothetical protein EP343_13750 [Deltaproteobacteria bacterium]